MKKLPLALPAVVLAAGVLFAAPLIVASDFALAKPQYHLPDLPYGMSLPGQGWRPGVAHNHTHLSDSPVDPVPGSVSTQAYINKYNTLGLSWCAFTEHYPEHLGFCADPGDLSGQYSWLQSAGYLGTDVDFAGVFGVELSPMDQQEYANLLALLPIPFPPVFDGDSDRHMCCYYNHFHYPDDRVHSTLVDDDDDTAETIYKTYNFDGGFAVVNHPESIATDTAYRQKVVSLNQKVWYSPTSPRYDLTRTPFGVEIANKNWPNWSYYSCFKNFLMEGAKVFPFVGRDAHRVTDSADPSREADDHLVVVPWTDSNGDNDIVGALRAGRFYVSSGSGIALWAFEPDESDCYWMGSEIKNVPKDKKYKFKVTYHTGNNKPGERTMYRVRIIKGNTPITYRPHFQYPNATVLKKAAEDELLFQTLPIPANTEGQLEFEVEIDDLYFPRSTTPVYLPPCPYILDGDEPYLFYYRGRPEVVSRAYCSMWVRADVQEVLDPVWIPPLFGGEGFWVNPTWTSGTPQHHAFTTPIWLLPGPDIPKVHPSATPCPSN